MVLDRVLLHRAPLPASAPTLQSNIRSTPHAHLRSCISLVGVARSGISVVSEMSWVFVGDPRDRDGGWRSAVGGLGCQRTESQMDRFLCSPHESDGTPFAHMNSGLRRGNDLLCVRVHPDPGSWSVPVTVRGLGAFGGELP